MIHALHSLRRQVREFFYQHLLTVIPWDDVQFMPPERIALLPPEAWPRNARGRRIRPERPEGRFKHVLRMQFGVWDLEVRGSYEHPPNGWIMLTGYETVEGPLDPVTWGKVAESIKQHHMGKENVA